MSIENDAAEILKEVERLIMARRKPGVQHGRWFRWNRDDTRKEFIVCLHRDVRVVRFTTQSEAEKAVADLDSLVVDYVNDCGGKICNRRSEASEVE